MTASMTGVRRVLGLTALLVGLVCGVHVAASGAAPAAPLVTAFPSAQTIPASGSLPAGGAPTLSLRAARGEREGAWLVARNGRELAATVDRGSLGPLGVELAWGHFVRVGQSSCRTPSSRGVARHDRSSSRTNRSTSGSSSRAERRLGRTRAESSSPSTAAS